MERGTRMKNLILFDDIPNEFYADEKYQVIDIEDLRTILDTVEWDWSQDTEDIEAHHYCPVCENMKPDGHKPDCPLFILLNLLKDGEPKRVAYCSNCKKSADIEKMSQTFAGNFCSNCSTNLRFQLEYGCTFEAFPIPMSFIHTRGDD